MTKTDRRCVCGHAESEHNETWVPCRGYSIHTSCKCEGFYPVCKIEEHRGPSKTPHPEATCEECGGPNVTWFAPNDLWNRVARRPDGSDPMLCPRCFIIRAEAAGINDSAWMVAPEPNERGPMTKTDPPPTVDLEKVRRYHYETVQDDCANCGTVWPCDAIKLADEVERLREELSKMYVNHPEDGCYLALPNLRAENTQMREALEKISAEACCEVCLPPIDLVRIGEIARAALPENEVELLRKEAADLTHKCMGLDQWADEAEQENAQMREKILQLQRELNTATAWRRF